MGRDSKWGETEALLVASLCTGRTHLAHPAIFPPNHQHKNSSKSERRGQQGHRGALGPLRGRQRALWQARAYWLLHRLKG